MTVPCPCCRAANDAGPACRRCKADLALLFAVEAGRAARAADGRRLLPDRTAEAAAALAQAARLRQADADARVRACALLLAGDFAGAMAAYHGVTGR